ncbi:pilus assembly protein CpaE [Selenomonas ruminantium]|uniref:Pilus assembly protein CpaE n=1 Tax=Selenomonas ruminantium TaxID=971 RepID=A0A1M6S456_SELRU|nr:AAA family ATPase [Selenomonas ruminantium]SHK39298.1 pilus assembly protein CpaE [Selenomonas ruminantium]
MEGHRSIIIAVFSTSSGCGKTITAINLAAGLADEGYRTCLVDLDLQFGDVMGYLDLVSDVTLADAQKAIVQDEERFRIDDYLTEYKCGDTSFAVLPPPREINDAYQVSVEAVEKIINSMRGFNFIVLDMTAVFSTLNLSMLDMSTMIVFLGVMDFLPSVKNYKVGYDTLLRFDYEQRKICLVENKADSERYIKARDVERLLGAEFYHHLPYDYQALTHSIRMGRPLMYSVPLSPLTQSYWHLVGKFTNRQRSASQQLEQQKTEKKRWLSWLLDKRIKVPMYKTR